MATILIIDDEPIIRQLFQKVLEHEGHSVLTAGNGREALEVMKHHLPDLLLLDMMMPLMDGMSFLRLMRRNANWAQIPVVIMSALADKQNVCNAGGLGVRDYLLKAGFSLPVLRKRIKKYLEPQPQQQTPEPDAGRMSGAGVAMLVE
jgi:CheY-like chemotaxis protein